MDKKINVEFSKNLNLIMNIITYLTDTSKTKIRPKESPVNIFLVELFSSCFINN